VISQGFPVKNKGIFEKWLGGQGFKERLGWSFRLTPPEAGFATIATIVMSAVEKERCKTRMRPSLKDKRIIEPTIDYSESQLPSSDDYLYYDEEHPVEDPDFSGEALSS